MQKQRSYHRRLFVTLLGLAVRHQNPVLATCLLDAGADPNTGYHWKISVHTGTVSVFLLAAINDESQATPIVNRPEPRSIHHLQMSIYSPIEEACLMQDKDMVRLLLKHGAKPNQPHTASSPLHAAIPMPIRMFGEDDRGSVLHPGGSTPTVEEVQSSATIVGMLLEAGADPDRVCWVSTSVACLAGTPSLSYRLGSQRPQIMASCSCAPGTSLSFNPTSTLA